MTPDPCQCGFSPRVYAIGGSTFRLRAFGCSRCRVTGRPGSPDAEALAVAQVGRQFRRAG